MVRNAKRYQNSGRRLHQERCAQQCAKDQGVRQFTEAELVHIERAITPDKPQSSANQYREKGKCHGIREESKSAGGEDYADEAHLSAEEGLSLIHISEPTRRTPIS